MNAEKRIISLLKKKSAPEKSKYVEVRVVESNLNKDELILKVITIKSKEIFTYIYKGEFAKVMEPICKKNMKLRLRKESYIDKKGNRVEVKRI